jgi:hypothetical protein
MQQRVSQSQYHSTLPVSRGFENTVVLPRAADPKRAFHLELLFEKWPSQPGPTRLSQAQHRIKHWSRQCPSKRAPFTPASPLRLARFQHGAILTWPTQMPIPSFVSGSAWRSDQMGLFSRAWRRGICGRWANSRFRGQAVGNVYILLHTYVVTQSSAPWFAPFPSDAPIQKSAGWEKLGMYVCMYVGAQHVYAASSSHVVLTVFGQGVRCNTNHIQE